MTRTPTSRGRLLACIIAVVGAVIAASPSMLGAGYALVLFPLVLGTGILRPHVKFLGIIVMPVAVMALVVWPLLMGAPPGKPAGSDPSGALRYASLTVLRLAVLGSIFQVALLPLSPAELTATLWRWGLRREWLITILAAVILGPEIRRRTDRVITAGLSRGVVGNRSAVQRLRLLVLTLFPLMAWSLQSAMHRADMWHERKLLDRIERLGRRPEGGSIVSDVALTLIASSWTALVVVARWRG
jgi:energy-coupling factor transporter transmembrane protein EcfT